MKLKHLLAACVAAGLLTACAATEEKPAEAAAKPVAKVEQNNQDLYEVHHDGRIYIFDDYVVYQKFVASGHTPYIVARIGAGPKGQTIKFGLRGKDKKKRAGIASIDMYEKTLAPAEPFYGEMRLEGRIYVFNSLKDMESVRITGEAPYRFTEIGMGPKGETVVYVLNKSNKKKKPVALISAFKKKNKMM